jgi:diaminohydroxyphosphoribosylaminopyrimidine deaminase / 5-amino-6-(5-phosphoribosylamino)uracil reductase
MNDEHFMRRCLRLAAKGGSAVRPNPQVGCVVVKDDIEIASGWHRRFGEPHAEAEALRKAGPRSREATLYVTLEPCNHQGKTPPCTEAIIDAGIRRVVIGMRDPNPSVRGHGLERLRSAGIECVDGVLESECRDINRIFEVNVTERRPFITMKIAQSFDGFIARKRQGHSWFTSESSRSAVHELRSSHEGILVGAGTVRTDNPRLTLRQSEGSQPWRIVLSGSLRLPASARLFTDEHKQRTIVLTTVEAAQDKARLISTLARRGVVVLSLQETGGRISLRHALTTLYDHGIYTVMVEGGSGIFQGFLERNLADDLHLFQAPMLFGAGVQAFPDIRRRNRIADLFILQSAAPSGADIHAIYRRKRGL